MSICAVVVVLNMLQAWSSASLVDSNVDPSGRVYAGQQDIRIVMRGQGLAADTSQSRIDRILTAWERQEAMFQTMWFATSWEIGNGQGGSLQESQEYLIAKDGRFRLSRNRRSFGNELSTAKDGLLENLAFDGQVDWSYERRAESSPFAEIGRKGAGPSPIGLPTYFMPHLIGDWFRKILADPNGLTWSDFADGLWAMECRQKPSGARTGVVFDPKQDFLVTRVDTWSEAKELSAWIQTEYCRTSGGFWYPSKADYKSECGWTAKMVTTDFRLNERDPKFQIDITTGTLVVDYRTDPKFPET